MKSLSVEISIKDIDVFDELLDLLKVIRKDKRVPLEVQKDVNRYLDSIRQKDKLEETVCPNCGAILIDKSIVNNTKSSAIHLPMKQIEIKGDKAILGCNCGCKCEVVLND